MNFPGTLIVTNLNFTALVCFVVLCKTLCIRIYASVRHLPTEWRCSSWAMDGHGSDRCMRCCDTLDWKNENVPGVAKEGQPTEEIEAQSCWRKWRQRWSTNNHRWHHWHVTCDSAGNVGCLPSGRGERATATEGLGFWHGWAHTKSMEIIGGTPLNGEQGAAKIGRQ